MSRKPQIWVCGCCHENQRFKPGEYICLRCSKDASWLRTVYTQIITRFPALSSLTMGEVFYRLWVQYAKAHPKGKKRPAIPPDPRFFPCTLEVPSCIVAVKEELCENPF